jgi:hydroxymethylglutaryl-CoA lyase/(R)-citramalyl-CoA lyase
MHVTICDVGPRDGLQNDPTLLDPPTRAELCRRLVDAGLPFVEAVSFVNDKRVPKMAGAETVWSALPADRLDRFAALVLNEKGYDRALACGVGNVHYAIPVTDAFALRNQGTTVEAGLALVERLVQRAHADRVRLDVTLAVAFGCPFDGPVPTANVLRLVERIASYGPDGIGLADTIGVAVPRQVRELVQGTSQLFTGVVSAHFHNTRNTGYANALAAVESGCTTLDASVAGIGGCPFAPRATGNIATEDLVYLLHHSGYETGIDLPALIEVGRWLEERLEHVVPGLLLKAGDFGA